MARLGWFSLPLISVIASVSGCPRVFLCQAVFHQPKYIGERSRQFRIIAVAGSIRFVCGQLRITG